MSDIVIRTDNLSKLYRIGEHQGGYKTLRETIVNTISSPFRHLSRNPQTSDLTPQLDHIWALKDISLEVKRGEVAGIIGRNGAGKTTLLKILSRITEPTEGLAEIRGRVGSLLEVGTGFHPELTGRENIYLNGAILGMKKAEMDRKFDEIVAFAEIEMFMDTPVKRYSSGMYIRLAFAVAAHLEPEILLVDEVLAVGDVAFQKKCLGKMGEVSTEGRTVLFVSHNMGAITHLCRKAIWLDQGRIRLDGECTGVVEAYLSSGMPSTDNWVRPLNLTTAHAVELLAASVHYGNDNRIRIANFDRPFEIRVEYEVKEPIRDLAISLSIVDAQGNTIFTTWDIDSTDWRGRIRHPGVYRSICELPGSLLRPGRYWVTVGSHIYNFKAIEFRESLLSFEVSQVNFPFNEDRLGILTPVLQWIVERHETAA
jgi:lipopolysaccharide transport system ATP-binding protein